MERSEGGMGVGKQNMECKQVNQLINFFKKLTLFLNQRGQGGENFVSSEDEIMQAKQCFTY